MYPLKPAPEIVRDDRPELGVFGGELEVRPMHCAAVSVPRRQLDVVPTIQNPALHVGWHEAPAARVLEHVPRAPLVGAVTEHGVYVGAGVGVDVGVGVGATVLGMSEL